jgi:hypothetical protein
MSSVLPRAADIDLEGYRERRVRAGYFRSAARRGDRKEMKRLLAEGANIESADSMDKTALMCACEYGSFETVKWLVGLGARMDRRDSERRQTPLAWAIEGSCPESAPWLAKKMAKACPEDLACLDVDGESAASLAWRRGDFATCREILGVMLESRGYDATKLGHARLGETFLQMHADWESWEVAQSAKMPKDGEVEGAKRL